MASDSERPSLHVGTMTAEDRQPVNLDHSLFLRHMACLGSSGSGKTVLCKAICEEAAQAGIPVIAVDPQGDIASLICRADPDELQEHGIDAEAAAAFHEKVEVVVWTPGSTAGVPICVNPLEFSQVEGRRELQVRSLALVSESLSAILGYDPDSDDGRYATAIFNVVFEYTVSKDIELRDFDDLADLITNMPENLRKKTLRIAPASRLQNIVRELRLLTLGTHRLLFSMGVPLSIDRLIGRDIPPPEGRTRVSVIYLNSLSSQEEKDFFVAQLVNQLHQWMLQNPSSELQALYYIDEIAPFLPPVRKTACRDGLRLLFKQARKYGLGCLIATQNPGDVDYRSLAQFATWALGRLMVRQDIKKIERIVRSLAPADTDETLQQLPKLAAGEFFMISPDQFDSVVNFKARWLYSDHRTIDEENVTAIMPEELRERFEPLILDPFENPEPEEEQAEDEEQSPDLQEALEAPEPSAPEPAQPASASPGEEVVEVLKDANRPMGVRSIAQSLDISESTLRRRLAKLEAEGDVKARQVGRRKVYWRPAEDGTGLLDAEFPILLPETLLADAEARTVMEANCERTFFYENEGIGTVAHDWLYLWRFRPGERLEGRKNPLGMSDRSRAVCMDRSLGRVCVIDASEEVDFRDPDRVRASELEWFEREYGALRQASPEELPLTQTLPSDVADIDQVRQSLQFRLGFQVEELALILLPILSADLYRYNETTRRTLTVEKARGRVVRSVQTVALLG